MAYQPYDPRAHSYPATLLIDGERRAVKIARLNMTGKTNVRNLIALFNAQEDRLKRIATEPILEQIPQLQIEREANEAFGQWVEELIAETVSPVEPWTSAEGFEVTDGASFVQAYPTDELVQALFAIFRVNELKGDTRKNSPSPRDSSPSSDGSTPTPATRGDAPAPVVEPAGPPSSATPEAAAALPETSPSGGMTATDASSPSPVPSGA